MLDWAAIRDAATSALGVPGKLMTITTTASDGSTSTRSVTGVSVSRSKSGIELLEDEVGFVLEGSANPVAGENLDSRVIVKAIPVQPADVAVIWNVSAR